MISAFWRCRATWLRSAHNTKWCLAGCAAGDFGTVAFFQYTPYSLPTLQVFLLAMMNGLLTSIALETVILRRGGFPWGGALRTAMGMSFISMLAMEAAMNLVDFLLTGGARIVWWVLPPALAAGFVTPWPYNYWRLKKFGAACH